MGFYFCFDFMVFKKSVFGTYAKDGVFHDRKESEQKRKGFRTPRKRKIKLKNPFHVYNYMFKYNKDFNHVPILLIKNKVKISNKLKYKN